LAQLAAPVAFEDEGLLSIWTRTKSFNLDALVDGSGLVSWRLMQSAFHMLRPTLNLSKTTHMVYKAWDDQFLDGFLALERWGNDNVSLPGEFYRQYIRDLYRKNLLVKAQLSLSGRPVDLRNIDCPLLVVSFEHDNIVPYESAERLVTEASSDDATTWRLPGGHVGAVVSRAASKMLWPQLAAWWAERDALAEGGRDALRRGAAAQPSEAARTEPAETGAASPPRVAARRKTTQTASNAGSKKTSAKAAAKRASAPKRAPEAKRAASTARRPVAKTASGAPSEEAAETSSGRGRARASNGPAHGPVSPSSLGDSGRKRPSAGRPRARRLTASDHDGSR
jgi:polyhydroxyalkanoate synthase